MQAMPHSMDPKQHIGFLPHRSMSSIHAMYEGIPASAVEIWDTNSFVPSFTETINKP